MGRDLLLRGPCECGATVGVYDSRPHPIGRMRRRRCTECGHRWETYEVPRATFLQLAGALTGVRDGLRALTDADLALRGLQPTLDSLDEPADGP